MQSAIRCISARPRFLHMQSKLASSQQNKNRNATHLQRPYNSGGRTRRARGRAHGYAVLKRGKQHHLIYTELRQSAYGVITCVS